MNNEFEKKYDNAKDTAKDLTNKAVEAGKDLKREAKNTWEDVKDAVSDDGSKLVEEAKKACSHSYKKTKDQFCKCQDDMEAFIKEKPFTSTAVALGVGFLLALCVGGKKKRHHRGHHHLRD